MQSNVVKLTGNFMIVSIIETLSEGMTLAEKNGVSRQHIVDWVDAFLPAPPIQVSSCD